MRQLFTALFAWVILGSVTISHAAQQLPDLGGSGYSVISTQQEYQLGRAWVRMLRGSAKLSEDALASQYIEELTWSLVGHSQLNDRRLEILLLDNPKVNAFAVPGGIIGVHTGLILAAENEAQLASVLSHELAHLSQRHFAAQLEEKRRNRPFMLASILGSILLTAADPEAGIVGLQSSMAANIANQLSFSRDNEREADHIGMQTLISAGYAPQAMAAMFEQLQKQARFSRLPPEFLLTHPITQARISDAQNRAQAYSPAGKRSNSLDFNIIRARLQTLYAAEPKKLLQEYLNQQQQNDHDGIRYAVAYSAIKNENFALAEKNMAAFSPAFRAQLSAKLLQAEMLMAQEKYRDAAEQLTRLRQIYPGNRAISYTLADALLKTNRPAPAVEIYESLTESNPNDSHAWYLLAEAYGLEGNIVAVHEARIEFFLLTANIDRALRQIEFALREKSLTEYQRARLEQRKEEALEIRQSLEMDF
ncbi:M48 family metalloprotease [Neptuniibacter halophilus]|uniref:M48 family metalloprotease n=1 Tax=Neptuniibacter halophilus TaxID=651666 RepID=UPI0025740EEF|nr:M48 family metalloprotease [Neptuniibacter halophilus]